jgi:teichuronic acid biosynthesis glycosyltransferase TuaG
MPAWNVQNYIVESIDSVLAQTYRHWELIIVDDGSFDKTGEIARNYLSDRRIRYLYQPNAGPGPARNTGIAHSQGDYIAFLDADDLWLPEKLALSLKLIIETGHDLIFTNCYIFEDGQDNPNTTKSDMGVEAAVYSGPSGLWSFIESNRIPTLTVLVKANLLKKTGPFRDSRAAEDYDMWLRLLDNGASFSSDPRCLSAYRIRAGSITATDRLALADSIRVLNYFRKGHPDYQKKITELLQCKFKYWLYNGYQPGSAEYRNLLDNIYPLWTGILLTTLSYIIPFKHLRKITNRLV